ncbi:MAG TPA: amidohydrolase family protein [Thermoanaerobaculia bacterium]|jgi:cytosine/adenosine deaminase-related metal-dependent hydrolase|nr:amidohydrolase family protein [Thermoanaerobaculia bacterium]
MRFLLTLLLTASAAFADTYALRGTLVTPDEVIENGVLLVQDGTIADAGASVVIPAGVPEIDTGGFIFPGLIDLHNHVTWNAHPRWSPGTLVKNRYEWQAMDSYAAWLSGPHDKAITQVPCELERFGEVKAMAWGATAVAGSLLKDCSRGLIRNLDHGDDFGKDPLQYRIFPFELRPADEESVRTALADGKPVIVHLAEGVDASSARELRMARAHGYLKPGLVIVHGVALTATDFEELGAAGVGLVWSPRSNIELYGRTTDVRAAKKHVVIAIAPDWAPSGSNGMIPELRYAALWNSQQRPSIFEPKELVQMATANPARLAHVDDKVGRLAKGLYADYLVIRRGAHADPYESLIYAGPEDILLVAVNGRPLFGDLKLLPAVNPSAKPETITLCNEFKAIDLSGEGISFIDTFERLAAAFRIYQIPITDLCP